MRPSSGGAFLANTMQPSFEPLPDLLRIAVPMWIDCIRLEGGVTEEHIAALQDLEPILERADELLLYRGKNTKDSEIANSFNTLARSLAIMAHFPGGVTIFDSSWDAALPPPYCQFHPDDVTFLCRQLCCSATEIIHWEKLDILLRRTSLSLQPCVLTPSSRPPVHLGKIQRLAWMPIEIQTNDRHSSETELPLQFSLL